MLTRRSLLQHAGLAGFGLAFSGLDAWALPGAWRQVDATIVPFTDVPADFSTMRGDRVVGMDLRQLESFITPETDLFVVAHYGVPQVDAAGWRLVVDGRAGRPQSLTLADLQGRARAERMCAFECGGNGARVVQRMVGNATWTGTPLWEIVAEAGPAGDAAEVVLWASDEGEEEIRGEKYTQNFARSISLADLRESGAILAWEMNGQPLTPAHGFPVRAVFPGYFGVQNVKWLRRLEISNERFMGRFQARDYVTVMGRQAGGRIEWVETSVAKQRTKSMIARVTRRAGGPLQVFGVAITDGTPLTSVEVQLDEGAWVDAALEPPPNPYAWTFFRAEVPAPPAGEHTIVSKATDALGRTQPVDLSLKKTYWEDYAQWRRTIQVS